MISLEWRKLMKQVKDMKITVIGLGYIGLPTASIMAKAGMEVLG